MTPSAHDADWLDEAERVVGYRFADRGLLAEALTHPSYSTNEPTDPHYERLEFLGDAALGLIIVEEIHRRFPLLAEGGMTKLKIGVVSGPVLAEAAQNLGLGPVIRLGDSERSDGGRGRSSALENAFEAVVGAIYTDAGLDAAREFVLRVLGNLIDPAFLDDLEHPKSRLQELLQSRGEVPVYRIVAEVGPPHERMFRAEVLLGERVLGTGTGTSKRAAEMAAAEDALGAPDIAGEKP